MVFDYCHLNKGTVKNNYPLPLILQLVDRLKGCTWFTKMNLCWRYNNVRIKQGDKWKGAFVMHVRAYEPLVMFFRMCNSHSTFQQIMNGIFRDFIEEGFIVIYMDDLLIFTKDLDQKAHMKLVRHVLQR